MNRLASPRTDGYYTKYIGDFDSYEQCAASPNIDINTKAITIHGPGTGHWEKTCYAVTDSNTREPQNGITCGVRP